MASRIDLPEAELRHLYVDEGLPSTAIAARLGCHPLTVRARLRDYGIPLRPRGWHKWTRHVPDNVLNGWPSPDLAYAVGLIASDGNLPKRNNCVVLTSTDQELADVFPSLLGMGSAHVTQVAPRPPRKRAYIVQVCDYVFRAFVEARGLRPNKTLSIGALDIPDEVFVDFLRGEMDGDGTWVVGRGWRGVRYLIAKFVSKSRDYLIWLQAMTERLAGVEGRIAGHGLVFNGHKAEQLGAWLYYRPGLPCLQRKQKIWEDWAARREAHR